MSLLLVLSVVFIAAAFMAFVILWGLMLMTVRVHNLIHRIDA